MCQLDRLHQLRAEIYRIAKKHNAEKVYVFGSCARYFPGFLSTLKICCNSRILR